MFESDQDLFFFQTVKIPVQKKNRPFICLLMFFGFVARFKNRSTLVQTNFTVVA